MQTRAGRLAIAAGLTVAASLGLAAGAAAATITVDTITDENDGPGPPVAGSCSLREATMSANTDTAVGGCPAGEPSDKITFDPAALLVDDRIDLATVGTQLELTGNTEIAGPGSGELEVTNTNATDRILFVDTGGPQVLISGLAISSGAQEGNGVPGEGSWRGGGILNHSPLTLTGVALRDNTVLAHGDEGVGTEAIAEGAAIWTDASLTVDSSTIEDNIVAAENADPGVFDVVARGAGIYHQEGPLEITNSVIAGNTASINDQSVDTVGIDMATGAGIHAGMAGVIERSTIWGNSVSATGLTGSIAAKGAGAMLSGLAQVELSTITANSASGASPAATDFRGAGLHLAGDSTVVSSTIARNGDDAVDAVDTDGANLTQQGAGDLTVTNTIVTEPVGATPAGTTNCTGSLVSDGFNVEYDSDSTAASCNFTQASDLPDPSDVTGGTDPMLGALADNGGIGETMLPEPGPPVSPVIDKGSAAEQDVADEDQRGFDRPAFFDDISNAPGGDGSDIGAVEVQIAPPTFTGTNPASPNDEDTPNVLGLVPPADSPNPLTVRLFTNASCTVPTGPPTDPGLFEDPGILTGPFAPGTTTTFYGTVESDYGDSHCSTGPFPNTITYAVPGSPQPPPVVTPPPASATPAPPRKKCKKGFVKKRGKCVRKKRKKVTK
jgi:hypothetical protein